MNVIFCYLYASPDLFVTFSSSAIQLTRFRIYLILTYLIDNKPFELSLTDNHAFCFLFFFKISTNFLFHQLTCLLVFFFSLSSTVSPALHMLKLHLPIMNHVKVSCPLRIILLYRFNGSIEKTLHTVLSIFVYSVN